MSKAQQLAALLNSNGQLDADDINPDVSVGSVVQTVTWEWSTYTSAANTTYADITNAFATITPKYADSKILIMATMPAMLHSNTGAQSFGLRLLRNGAQIWQTDRYVYKDVVGWSPLTIAVNQTDLPNTTSAVTYKFQGKIQQSTYRVNDHYQNSTDKGSTIILMEVAQ